MEFDLGLISINFWTEQNLPASQEIRGTYSYPLVAFSYLIAVAGSYVALLSIGQIEPSHGNSKALVWQVLGAAAMGLGIWSMHFIGMIAYEMPVDFHYSTPITVLSILPGFLSSLLALFILSSSRAHTGTLVVSSVVVAIGIAAMHIVGMEAMHVDAEMGYIPDRFGLAVLAGFILAYVALDARTQIRAAWPELDTRWVDTLSALVIGLAISAIHYTAMWATQYFPGHHRHGSGMVLSDIDVGLMITSALLVQVIVATLVHQNHSRGMLERSKTALADTEHRWRSALEATGQGVWDCIIPTREMYYSPVWRKMRGVDPHEKIDGDPELWLQRVHPDDRERLRETIRKQDTGEIPYNFFEYREKRRGGEYIWVRSRGTPIAWDNDGRPLRIVGVDIDITREKELELELKRNLELLNTTLDNYPGSICMLDNEQRIRVANKGFYQLGQINAEDFPVGTHIGELARYHAVKRNLTPEQVEAEVQQSIVLASASEEQRYSITYDDTGVTMQFSHTPLNDGGSVNTMTDVTHEKELERKIQSNLNVLSSTIDNFPGGIAMFDKNLMLMVANRGFYELNYINARDFPQGCNFEDIVREHGRQGRFENSFSEAEVERILADARAHGARRYIESYAHNGKTIEYARVPLDGGGFLLTMLDITDKVQAEKERARLGEEVAKNLQLLDTTLQNFPGGICMFDKDERLVVANKRYYDEVGLHPSEFPKGSYFKDILGFQLRSGYLTLADLQMPPSDDMAASIERIHKLATETTRLTIPVWRGEGGILEFTRVDLPDGGFVYVILDMTERTKAEQKRAELEREIRNNLHLLDTTFENFPGGIALFDSEMRLKVINKRFYEIDAVTEDELPIGGGLRDLIELHVNRGSFGEGDPLQLIEAVWQEATGPENSSSTFVLPAGRTAEYTRTRLDDGGFVLVIQDVTERIAAEKERNDLQLKIEQNLQLLNVTLENFPGGICMVGGDHLLKVANQRYYELTGMDEKRFGIGTHLRDILHHHAERGDFGDVDIDAEVARRLRNIDSGEAARFVLDWSAHGKFVEFIRTPVAEGGYILAILDITEKINADEKRKQLESELSQVQKMESLGTLASGVAHEINTPIQYVGDNIRFLQNCYEDIIGLLEQYRAATSKIDPEIRDSLKAREQDIDLEFLIEEAPQSMAQSLQGIAQVSRIVKAIKEFSHPSQEDMTGVDLNLTIDTTIAVSRNQWKYVAEIETDFSPDLPTVQCFQGDINQVVLNMIVNAAHAIEAAGGKERGVIRIATRREGGNAVIEISDNGTGMPEEVKARIFDPFFTTKDVGKGTGQGLAISYTIIHQKHHGTIECTSEVGAGTTFTIRLPIEGGASLSGKAA